MLASASPMLTRTPSLAKARTERARSPARAANSALSAPRLSHTKLPWASGTNQPSVAQPGRDPVPFVHQALYPFYNLTEVLQRCHGRCFGDLGDRERRGGDAQVLRELGLGHAVPNAQPGEAVGLGEGPQDNDVGVLPVHFDAVDGVLVADELLVGLVDDHHDVRRVSA